ncbi:MAG: oligosaccharide flippase family protein [Candidatus Aenigmatarchaeota archaeon]
MNEKKKLVSNTFYLFLNWFLLSVINFFFWSIVGKFLNPNEYGIATTAINFSIFLSGISLIGLTSAISKLIPEYLAKKQEKKVFSLINFSAKIIFFSNVFIIVILIILAPKISEIIKVPKDSIYLISITIFILSLSSILGSIIYGYQNMRVFMYTDLIGTLAKFILVISLFQIGFNYYAPIISFMIGYLLVSILRISKVKLEKNGFIDGKKVVANYALPAFISGLAMNIFYYSQYFLLSSIKTTYQTGIFSVAMIISSIILTVPNILTSALFPITSYLSVWKNKKRNQAYLIEKIIRYAFFTTLPLAMFLVIFSRQIILIFSSKMYLESNDILKILVFSNLLFGIGNIFNQNLYAIGKAKLQRNIVLVSVLTFLVLAFPLTEKFSYYGMVFSYLVSTLFFIILSYIFIKKFIGIKFPINDVFKILFSSLISFSILYIFVKISTSIVLEFIFLIFTLFLYLLILRFLKFYENEDKKILRYFSSKVSNNKFAIKILSLIEKFLGF